MKRFLDIFSKTEVANIAAVLIIAGCFIMLYLLIIKPIPVENKDVVNTAVGFVLGGALGGVTGYLFSASKNDKPDA